MSGLAVDELLDDPGAFADRVLGRTLWPHQLELARHPARYRVVCAGRQVGKSTLLAAIALHAAVTRRGVLVLLVSAGEEASKRLLAECSALAQAHLGGSVLDEGRSLLTFSNGSLIRSVPASERQIRGWPVDVLIIDEAGFVGQDIWRAAEPAIIARPGSRVVLASSPWGGSDHFFRSLWRQGTDAPDERVAAWHWPSSVSPLVDRGLLEQIRQREPADYFAREYLAEWTDAAGAYFPEDELMAAVADHELIDPASVPRAQRWAWPVVGGLDWGMAQDGNALAVASVLDPRQAEDGRWRVWFPWLEVHLRMPWSEWIERVVDVAAAFRMRVVASETNGVGAYPTDDLEQRLLGARTGTAVSAVWTDARRKQSGFGKLRMLMQADRLLLPRHPELLKQLRGLEFEQLAAGGMRISVPDRAGHDDLAMAAMQTMSCLELGHLRDSSRDLQAAGVRRDDELVTTGRGVLVPRRLWPLESAGWCALPAGAEKGDGW